MDAIFRLLYFSEQYPKNTAINYTMLTLCHHLEEIPRLSIDELAALCRTNPMMLSRIARRIGYNNFSEFRRAAAETLAQSRYLNRSIPMHLVDPTNPAESFLQYMEHTIAQLRAEDVTLQIEQICEALHATEKVHFYGPPHFSVYMFMLLHDLISDGKDVHLYTSRESILSDMDTITGASLVLTVPNDLALDVSFTQQIMETVEQKGGRLVLHTDANDPLLSFTRGPNLTYPGDHTAASTMTSAFVLNMLTMTYRNRYLDQK